VLSDRQARELLRRQRGVAAPPSTNLPTGLEARADPPHLGAELAQLRTLIRQHDKQRATVEMRITKRMAEAMLFLRIKRNRRIDRVWVEKLKAILLAGRFHSDVGRVEFDWDGNMQDAQHRLLAIFETGVEVNMDVAFGLDPASFQSKDTGIRRKAAQFLELDGIRYGGSIAATVRFQYRLDHNGGVLDDEGVYLLGKEMADDLTQIALHQAARLRKKRVITSSAVLAYRLIKLGAQRAAVLDQFWDRLAQGDDLKISDPIYKLREHFDRERNAKNRKAKQFLTQTQHAAWIIQAWNSWASGQTAVSFKWTDPNALPVVK